MASNETNSIYDFPKWYDLVYGSDWKAEYEFLLECFDLFVDGGVKSIFEPACGTGRLLYRLAKKGFTVSGNDLNEAAIEYCNQRLARFGFPPSALVGDMCDFELTPPVDVAFNLVSSFRHIIGFENAAAHLRCMRRALKPGGIYILGFHLSPTECDPMDGEHWSASRGHLTINSTMNLLERDWENRLERFNLRFDVYTPTETKSVKEVVGFQMYSKDDFLDLLDRDKQFSIEQTFDFGYDSSEPVELNDESEDIVFILRRN